MSPGWLLAARVILLASAAVVAGCGGSIKQPVSGSLYTVGGSVSGLGAGATLVLQDNGGDNLNVTANGTFTFATQLIGGSTYKVTALTQPAWQGCTVANGAGSVGAANVTNIAVTCTATVPRYAYVLNSVDSTISVYSVNAATGQLRANGYVPPPSAFAQRAAVAVHPGGSFAYVANALSNDVSAYKINANGRLTQISCGAVGTAGCSGMTLPTNFAAGMSPAGINVDPTGKFAYVLNGGSGNVSAYTINATTGALTSAGPAVAAGTGLASIAVDPRGRYAYVANNASNDVSAYAINATTGALTQIVCGAVTGGACGATIAANYAAGTGPIAVTVDPSGKFVYAANLVSNNVSAYAIGAGGVLSAVAGSPFALPAIACPGAMCAWLALGSVVVEPTGKFVYVVSSSGLAAFSINATSGALTIVAGSPFAAGLYPVAVNVDASGRFAYVVDRSGSTVLEYRINGTTGALTLSSTMAARGSPNAIVFANGATPVTYTPKFAYAANMTSNNVSAYTIDATTGALTAVAGSPYLAGTSPQGVAVHPAGQFAYVANNGGTISAYAVNATSGALTTVGGPYAAGALPYAVTVDPSGQFLYEADYAGTVSAYTINATTGALTAIVGSPFAAGIGAAAVAVDPTGKFAYAADFGTNTVSAYSINATTGALTAIAGSPFAAGAGAIGVTADPSGRFIYTANNAGNSVSAYSINRQTGALVAVAGSPFAAGSGAYSVTIDPTGRFAYVANGGAGTVSAYTINATTGALTAIVGSPYPAGTGPTSVTIDPSGLFAYVANNGSNNVSAYSINTATGALTPMSGAPYAAGTRPFTVTTAGSVQ